MERTQTDITGRDILDMTYLEFKSYLVLVHHDLVDDSTERGFVEGRGRGVGSESGVRFAAPAHEYQDRLLMEAHSVAREEGLQSGLAAIHLTAALLNIHPFEDGNGRTSRYLHAVLLGRHASVGELCVAHPQNDVDVAARRVVDLKPPAGVVEKIEAGILPPFKEQILAEIQLCSNGHDLVDGLTERLSNTEALTMNTVLRFRSNGEVATRSSYATAFALKELDIPGEAEFLRRTTSGRTLINLPQYLLSLDDRDLSRFFELVDAYSLLIVQEMNKASTRSGDPGLLGEYILRTRNLLTHEQKEKLLGAVGV